MQTMINWMSLSASTPKAGREIIAKNPLKPVSYRDACKQCKILKFTPKLSQAEVKERMIEDNLTLWAYVEGGM